jgi:hypothetical protein
VEGVRAETQFKAVDPKGTEHQMIHATIQPGYTEVDESLTQKSVTIFDMTTRQDATRLSKGCYHLADGTNLASDDPNAP